MSRITIKGRRRSSAVGAHMNRTHVAALVAAIGLCAPVARAETPPAADASDAKAEALLHSLHPRSGTIALPAAEARLDLGAKYDFLDAAEAKRVLVEGWGNPPDQVDGVLGLIFPHGETFLDQEGWAAVVTYEQTFYVSDKDVQRSDYDKLLNDMRSGEDAENDARKKGGFSPVHLIGWAQPPSYDRANHDLIWARDIRFGEADVDTLNYDVRHLGRRGVLSLNIVSTMPHLAEIRASAPLLARAAEFDAGARYADHKWLDKSAGYGLVGLVAAGTGLVVAKKVGLVALFALFAKKAVALLAVAGVAIANWLRRLTGRKPVSSPPQADRDETPTVS